MTVKKGEILQIPEEVLDLISGGVITEKEDEVLRAMVRAFKKTDVSKESADYFLRHQLTYENTALAATNAEEAADYVAGIWDSVEVD